MGRMGRAGVRFYYDLGSPYSYLAAERVDEVLGGDVEWSPVLLGAIFRARGRRSWADGEARAANIAAIEARAAARHLPPLSWPDPWPNDGLQAMRAAILAHRAGRGPEFAMQALRVHFRDGLPLSEREPLVLALERAGLDPASTLAAIGEQDVKDELRERTEAALALGITGVPSVLAGGRLFWGDDHLEDAAGALPG